MKDLVSFFREVVKLKEVKRKGWVIDKIKDSESVSDHSYMVSLMTLILGEKRKDINLMKALKMALIHDIHESITGDIVPISRQERYMNNREIDIFDEVTDKEKFEKEKEAFEEISKILGDQGKEYMKLWKETEISETTEAIFVKSVDRLELAIQAMEYAKKYPDKDLTHYMKFCRDSIKDPGIRKIFDRVEKMMPVKDKNR